MKNVRRAEPRDDGESPGRAQTSRPKPEISVMVRDGDTALPDSSERSAPTDYHLVGGISWSRAEFN